MRQEHEGNSLIPFFVGMPVFIWQVIFFCIPLLIIVMLSITKYDETGHFFGITFSHFSYFFNGTYLRIIGRSLALALSNALICLSISYPLAYFLAFKIDRLKNFFLFLLVLPLWTNFLLHIYAWFFVLERGGVINTLLLKFGLIAEPLHLMNNLFAIMVMMVYYYLPFMALPLYIILEKFNTSLIEASLDLGATWSQTFLRLMLPLTLPGIISGFFLVFVPSFAEFAIPELMGGDKDMFVGSVVSHLILGNMTIVYGAAFTLLSSLALIISALCIYWLITKVVTLCYRGSR